MPAASLVHYSVDAGNSISPVELVIGPAVPAAIGSFGAAIATVDDEVIVRPFREGRIEPFPDDIKPAAAYPPAVVDGVPPRIYWVSKGRLVRRKIAAEGRPETLEVLTSDAADNTRVFANHVDAPVNADMVLYIGMQVSRELERRARLWVERQTPRTVTPDGAGATSVNTVALGEGRFALLSLDGRRAMSPVHARYVQFDAMGTAQLGDDHVVYVAGPAEGHIEMSGVRVGTDPVALVPIAHDVSAFGLVSLKIGQGEGEAPSLWWMYPNGLVRAMVAATTLCEEPAVAFVQPEDASPSSRKVVQVAKLDAEGRVVAPLPIASAMNVRSLVFASVPSEPAEAMRRAGRSKPIGAWIAYAADGSLRARPVLCH